MQKSLPHVTIAVLTAAFMLSACAKRDGGFAPKDVEEKVQPAPTVPPAAARPTATPAPEPVATTSSESELRELIDKVIAVDEASGLGIDRGNINSAAADVILGISVVNRPNESASNGSEEQIIEVDLILNSNTYLAQKFAFEMRPFIDDSEVGDDQPVRIGGGKDDDFEDAQLKSIVNDSGNRLLNLNSTVSSYCVDACDKIVVTVHVEGETLDDIGSGSIVESKNVYAILILEREVSEVPSGSVGQYRVISTTLRDRLKAYEVAKQVIIDAQVPAGIENEEAAPEAAVEAAPEAAAEATPEAAVEAAPEAAVEAAPEAAVEAAPEAAVEAAVEAAPEAAVEAAPEAAVEAAPEAAAEAAPEAAAEAAPEAAAE